MRNTKFMTENGALLSISVLGDEARRQLSSRERRRSTNRAVAVAVLSGLFAFAVAWPTGRVLAERKRQRALDLLHRGAQRSLQQTLVTPLAFLSSLAEIFESQGRVTEQEFSIVVDGLLKRQAGVHSVQWVAMDEAGDRASVIYERPDRGTVGLDIANSAETRRRLGRAEAGRPVLVVPPSPFGARGVFTVVQPVFANHGDNPTMTRRLRGYVTATIELSSLLDEVFREQVQRVAVAVKEDATLLWESEPGFNSTLDPDAPDVRRTLVEVADRRWTLYVRPASSLGATSASLFTWLVGPLTTILVMLAWLVWDRLVGLRYRMAKAVALGQYTLTEPLDDRDGELYIAQHGILKRPTVVRLVHSEDPAVLRQFQRQVQVSSELTHPNTVEIYDYGKTPGGLLYCAMERIDGLDLRAVIERDGAMPPARAVCLLAQAAGAVHEAHIKGLVHRDLKPQSLILCTLGGLRDFVKVTDFGLAKRLRKSGDGSLDLTQASQRLGLNLFAPPEVVLDERDVDARSDVYALGGIGLFLVTGRPPYPPDMKLRAILERTPPPLDWATDAAPLDAAFVTLMTECLSWAADRRPASALHLAEALQDLSEQLDGWNDARAEAWWRERWPTIKAEPPSSAG